MLSSVLRSARAVEVNIAIMRTFVQLRRLMDTNRDLARKIEALEKKYDEQFADVFAANQRTRCSPGSAKEADRLPSVIISPAELEKVTEAWPPISRAVRVPHTDADYREIVELLDRVTDEVGENEKHPLASLMDVLGVLIEKYEDEHVPELTE